jgi:uncharacterized membrane protein
MSEKRSKYDTDPLDPDFVRQTEEISGAARETTRTSNEQARLNPDADAPTRRIDDPLSQPYPSIFVPPTPTTPPPPAYQQPPYQQPSYQQPTYQQPPYQQPPYQQPSPAANLGHTAPMAGAPQRPAPPTSRAVAGIGIPENVAVVLPYVPLYIGIVGAIIELLLVPRTETRVRFHAAQGLALQLAILAISFAFGIIGNLTGSTFGGKLFWLASFIFLIVSIIRVWKGETHHLTPLDEATSWLYQRIEPRK